MTTEELQGIIDAGKRSVYYKNDPRFKWMQLDWGRALSGHKVQFSYMYGIEEEMFDDI